MACFLLLHNGYDAEVMSHLSYGYGMDIYNTGMAFYIINYYKGM